MATVILIEATPADENGNLFSVRMAGGGSRGYDHKGSTDWLAGVATPPLRKASIGYGEDGWTGRSGPATLEMRYSASSASRISRIGKLYWDGARIIVSTGDDAAAAPLFTPVCVGTVTSFAIAGSDATITITDLSAELDVAAATGTFAGTGDLEGDDAATGRVKRLSWGRVFNVEGRVLSAAYNIYEFGDLNQQIANFVDVRDMGRSGVTPVTLPWQGSALTTLNALKAATPPSGGAVIAPSIQCVKWWTQPAGPLTADLKGMTTPTSTVGLGDMAAAIALRYATDIVAPASEVAGLNAARPGDVGIHVDDASTTAAALLDQLLLGASSLWTIDPDGTLRLRPWSFEAPVLALPCQDIQRTALLPPLLTRKVGFQRNWRVQSAGEIASTVSSSDVYYQDGTPIEVLKPIEAGANVTENRVSAAFQGQTGWATMAAPTTLITSNVPNNLYNPTFALGFDRWSGTGFAYSRGNAGEASYAGTSQPGTNVLVSDRQSCGPNTGWTIQGELLYARDGGRVNADIEFYRVDGSVTGRSERFSLASAASGGTDAGGGWRLGASARSIAPGDTVQMATRIFTEGGTSGLAAWRRLKTHNGSGVTLYSDEATSGATYPDNTTLDALRPGERGSNVTETRVASAFYGQRALATMDAVDFSSGNVTNRFADYLYYGNTGVTVQYLKPAEPGSNVTESRVAAAFYGQRALATLDSLDLGSGYITGKYAENIRYGYNNILVSDLRPGEANANTTETRVASAVAGQGALATQSKATGFVCYSDSNTYAGSGGPSTGSASGGSGGSINRGGSIP